MEPSMEYAMQKVSLVLVVTWTRIEHFFDIIGLAKKYCTTTYGEPFAEVVDILTIAPMIMAMIIVGLPI